MPDAFTVNLFCVIAQPRTGSNALMSALNSVPELTPHYEIFHPDAVYLNRLFRRKASPEDKQDLMDVAYRNQVPDAYLERLIAVTANLFPGNSLGWKMFYWHNDDILLKTVKDDKIKKIILYRENKLDQYLSEKIAIKTGSYVVHQKGGVKTAKVDFSYEEFMQTANNWSKEVRELLDIMEQKNDPNYILIEYNDIFSYKVLDVIRFLGYRERSFKISTKKQNPSTTKDKVNNFKYLKNKLAGTEYEKWIRD